MRLASAVFRRLHSDLVNLQFRSLRMVDPSGKGSGSGSGSGSEAEEANPNGASSGKSPTKTCADCGTTKTPLWRGGPAGPKSLCNACGIRSRKKKRAILGVSKGGSNDESKRGKRSSGNSNNSSSSNKLGDSYSLKQRLLALGREVLMQRSSVRKKLGEEEQAAVVLMSLSYAESVYA